jgi:NADPH:quinone reductase-like Zn-dependent oxidoreductase
MKRVVIDQFGGPEVLKVVDDDIPEPGPGEARVRVLAAGVSFSDALLRAEGSRSQSLLLTPRTGPSTAEA